MLIHASTDFHHKDRSTPCRTQPHDEAFAKVYLATWHKKLVFLLLFLNFSLVAGSCKLVKKALFVGCKNLEKQGIIFKVRFREPMTKCVWGRGAMQAHMINLYILRKKLILISLQLLIKIPKGKIRRNFTIIGEVYEHFGEHRLCLKL